ncbi:hypothetical protein BpHYR1_020769, partial [Brachionus plicatilis]
LKFLGLTFEYFNMSSQTAKINSFADTGIIAFNELKEMAPAISNIVTASQSNVLILNEIQAIKNELSTFKEDTKKRFDELKNDIQSSCKNLDNIQVIRTKNSSCIRDKCDITWIEVSGKDFPNHEINTLDHFNEMNGRMLNNDLGLIASKILDFIKIDNNYKLKEYRPLAFLQTFSLVYVTNQNLLLDIFDLNQFLPYIINFSNSLRKKSEFLLN